VSTNVDDVDEILLSETMTARDRFIEAQHGTDTACAEYHHAIRRLHAAGGSMREIARALGLSHQRVHQIIDEPAAPRAEARKKTLLWRLATSSGQEDPAAADRPVRSLFAAMSPAAREVMTLTENQARSLGHRYIGTEHILLGLLTAERGIACRVLAAAGVSQRQVRTDVERIIGRGKDAAPDGPLRVTPRSKKVLALARSEARHDRSTHVRSEHLLLGLLREGGGVAATVLTRLGADHDDLRDRIRQAGRTCSFCRRDGLDAAGLVAGPGVFICERCTQAATRLTTSPPTSPESNPADPSIILVPVGQPAATCGFCGKKRADVEHMAASQTTAICSPCLTLCREIQVEQEGGAEA